MISCPTSGDIADMTADIHLKHCFENCGQHWWRACVTTSCETSTQNVHHYWSRTRFHGAMLTLTWSELERPKPCMNSLQWP